MDTITSIQGMRIFPLDKGREGQCLASGPYFYGAYFGQKKGQRKSLPIRAFTLVVLEGSCLVAGVRVSAGECLLQQGEAFDLSVVAEECAFLVAGKETATGESFTRKFAEAEAKKVAKPWGMELWLSGEGQPYSLKKIVLREGFRTSLQFHRVKHETNLILEGKSELTYNHGSIESGELRLIELACPVAIDIQPGTIHRLKALSDLTMYEASTPDLDDVIRLEDDTFRGDGRISSEH